MSAILHSNANRHTIAPGRERYLAHTDNLMMVVIEFSNGPAETPDPPHHHVHEQVTYVAEGKVRFFVDGVPHDLSAGDMIAVPSNVPHGIQLLTPYVRLVDSFNPIREDFLK
jgi:quercetin dioxygenase-like cupin family protein